MGAGLCTCGEVLTKVLTRSGVVRDGMTSVLGQSFSKHLPHEQLFF
jgi:hypothetical protein